ncbi:MAG: TetR family transcriptional regulator C-terminal domain-containing protein [Pseudolabrys sp.]
MQSLLAEMGTSASAQERIVRSVDAAVAGLVQHISLYPVSLEVWAAAARTQTRDRFAHAMQQTYTDYRREIVELVRSAQSAGELKANVDAESLAMVLVGAVDGLMLQYWLDPSIDPHRVVRNFFTALFEGIGQP